MSTAALSTRHTLHKPWVKVAVSELQLHVENLACGLLCYLARPSFGVTGVVRKGPGFAALFNKGPVRIFSVGVVSPFPRFLVNVFAWCVKHPLEIVREVRVALGVPGCCNLCLRDWVTCAVGGLELFKGQPWHLPLQHVCAALEAVWPPFQVDDESSESSELFWNVLCNGSLSNSCALSLCSMFVGCCSCFRSFCLAGIFGVCGA
mmetsp:Transcript_130096/g.259514  ORF Transcript_130096/g.259514 Transcript_130096/m.259514 type:complete len:205 (-) Transcript_130096:248-862(-)